MKLWILQVWAKKHGKMIYAGWTQVLSEISKKMSGAKHSPTFLEVRRPFGAFWTLSRKYMMSSWVSGDLTEMCVSNRRSRRSRARLIDEALNSASMNQKAWKSDHACRTQVLSEISEKWVVRSILLHFSKSGGPSGHSARFHENIWWVHELQMIWLKCVFPTGKAEDRKLDW